MQICVSLFTLMVGVFVHPELVVKPGLDQMGAAYLVMVATLGITFTLQATYSPRRAPIDLALRAGLAAMSLYILLSFNDIASDFISVRVLGFIAYWIVVRRTLVARTNPPATRRSRPAFASAPIADAPLGRMS